MTYGNSRANTHNFNYNIIGSDTGLQWTNQQYSGTLTGAANTEDDTTQQHILWEPVGCNTFTSIASSSWSLTSTWNSGIVPTSCNPVVIAAGTTVMVDISSATASSTTINGDLQFSRTNSSTFTVIGGSVSVNAGGTLDMGTASSPLSISSATLILAYGSTAGQYGLVINNGGNFLVYGAVKTPGVWSAQTVNPGGGSVDITNANTLGWNIGDTITLDTEAVVVTTLNSTTIGFAPLTTLTHTAPYIVADLTRNVIVRSSGTNTSSNTAYIQDLALKDNQLPT